MTFEINRRLLAGAVAVSDCRGARGDAVGAAGTADPGRARWRRELAAVLHGRIAVTGKTVAVILTGGNIDAGDAPRAAVAQAGGAMSCRIVAATAADVGSILTLIRGLADYGAWHTQVVATEDSLRRTLFGPRAAAETLLAYADAGGAVVAPVGFALFFGNYSTFLGQAGVYLEDLFVLPAFRGQGIRPRLFRAGGTAGR